MFVYVWKHNETPFYVGMTKNIGRTNPLNSGGRGWLCRQKLEEVGRSNVVVEIHTTKTLEGAQELEKSLIEKYGRVQLGNGPLTNLRSGGEGSPGMSDEGKKSLSARMKANNPMKNAESRAKAKARMNDPDVKARITGEKNPSKRPEVRAKLKAKWDDPSYRSAKIEKQTGKPIHTEEHKSALRERLLDPANPMREYHKTLNSDPIIAAKRKAAVQSEEVRSKHRENANKRWSDPAKREALAEKMKAIWATRKANMVKQ
jgi:GIY-YIG catalytic domain